MGPLGQSKHGLEVSNGHLGQPKHRGQQWATYINQHIPSDSPLNNAGRLARHFASVLIVVN